MINLSHLIKDRTVDIYSGTNRLAGAVRDAVARQTTLYTRDDKPVKESGVITHSYDALLEASDCIANICMLNDRSIKVLVAMYPSAPQYVLVRLAPRLEWFLGLAGLIRRLIFGLVRIEGIGYLKSAQGTRTYWLVLEQSGGAVHSIPVLPKAVGMPAFLEWLQSEKISYVVLRFYEKLPQLHRAAGDLDMLVSDEDRAKVEGFLKKHEGSATDLGDDIRVGLHSVSGEPGMIPYYPPPLARQILARAIDGPAGSLIPAPKDALCSFIYHTLYHSKKGYSSGIPSTLAEHTDNHPENDYLGVIKRLAEAERVVVGETMEDLDNYMAQEGWRPKLDTLAKIAETNAWVRDRFFSNTQNDLVGLSVFILREWVLSRDLFEQACAYIETQGYKIIRKKIFNTSEKETVKNNLRGGTWGTNEDGSTDGWLPASVLVIVDLQCVRMPPSYAVGFERFRIRKLKEELRQKFDTDGLSSMHSTDNTHESWEYIEVCYPDEIEAISEEVTAQASPSRFATWRHILKPAYIKHSFKHSLRGFLIRRFLN